MSLAEIARNIASLYKEVVTTSVRFDAHAEHIRLTLARWESDLAEVRQKLAAMHDEHVRLQARIDALEGRLSALSEQALHAVAREAARDLMRDAVGAPPRIAT